MGWHHNIKVVKPFQYYGGKTPLVDYILTLMPPHQIYCEPFAGSATVFWAKPPSPLEILNDLDFRIVAFYRCLRDERLWQRLQELCELTPYSRAEFYSAVRHIKECVANPKALDELSDDELLILAWRFYIVVQMTVNGRMGSAGWSHPKSPTSYIAAHCFRNKIAQFGYFHERLKWALIECDDALNVIRRYDTPDTFFFIDPPYLPELLKEPNNYDLTMTEDEHKQLLDLLCKVRGKVIITHPRCPLYDETLKKWLIVEVSYNLSASSGVGGKKGRTFSDALWLNYQPPTPPSLLADVPNLNNNNLNST